MKTWILVCGLGLFVLVAVLTFIGLTSVTNQNIPEIPNSSNPYPEKDIPEISNTLNNNQTNSQVLLPRLKVLSLDGISNSSLSTDNFSVYSVAYNSEKNEFSFEVSYLGGCKIHSFTLYVSQTAPQYYLSHNSNEDNCSQQIIIPLVFKLETNIRPYFYSNISENATVLKFE